MKPLSKWRINYPPKILCQTVLFYLLHRGNNSKIALQVPATSKYIILCTSNECRRSQVRNSAMRNSFIRKCLLPNQICFRRVREKHQALQFEHGCLYSWRKFLRGRKGHRRTTRRSNCPGTLPARESPALSKSNKNLCRKEGPRGRWLLWIPAASVNSPETLQGNRNQGEGLSHLRNYWRMVRSFCVHPFS